MTTTTAHLNYGELAAEYAIANLLGKPYALGGELGQNGINGIDCSGLTKLSWQHATAGKVSLFHQAKVQAETTARVYDTHIGYLRRGDLVFYEWSAIKGGYGHVSMFIGWLNGHRWVAQATDFNVLSEIIPIDLYVQPQAFGRVKYGDWDTQRDTQAEYKGLNLDRARFAHYL